MAVFVLITVVVGIALHARKELLVIVDEPHAATQIERECTGFLFQDIMTIADIWCGGNVEQPLAA